MPDAARGPRVGQPIISKLDYASIVIRGVHCITRQDNGEKRTHAVVPLYPYPCYTLD